MPIAAGDGYAAITTDPSTPIGMVRLLIADLNEEMPVFTDVQIQAFLTVEGGSRKLAAASALDAIARSHVLIARKFSTQDLSVDGPAVAAELRASAKALRDQVAAEGTDPDDPGGGGLDVVPIWNFPPANLRFDSSNYF